MPFDCPHCQAAIDGVVTQATLEDRLNSQRTAKDGEITLLRGQLGEASDKAGRFDTVEAERVRLASQVARLTDGAARRDQLVALGIHDPKVHQTFGVLYDSAVAGLEGEARPTFEAWLGDEESGARLNPVLAPMFGAGDTGNGSSGVPDPLAELGAKPPVMPPSGDGAKPGTPGQERKVDPGKIRRMLQNMSVSEVKAWQEQHGAKYGWNPPPAPPTS